MVTDQGDSVILVMLDLTAAFDMIDHKILIVSGATHLTPLSPRCRFVYVRNTAALASISHSRFNNTS